MVNYVLKNKRFILLIYSVTFSFYYLFSYSYTYLFILLIPEFKLLCCRFSTKNKVKAVVYTKNKRLCYTWNSHIVKIVKIVICNMDK